MGIAKLHAKMTCIHANILKKFWLKFRIHAKFRAKKLFISNECAISCKTGFVLIRKWCGISCKKVISCKTTQVLRKSIDCFVGTLLWRLGYPKMFLLDPETWSWTQFKTFLRTCKVLYWKIVETILARVQKVCLQNSLLCAYTL